MSQSPTSQSFEVSRETMPFSPTPLASHSWLRFRDATLAYDRGEKLLAYAIGEIPGYWIVNLLAGQLEVYTEPSGALDPVGYRRCQVLKPTEQLDLAIDGRILGRIAIADLLP